MPYRRARGTALPIGRLVALAVTIGLVVSAELWRSYGEVTTTAERSALGYVRLLGEQTERTVQAIDFTLLAMRDALLVAPGLSPNDPAYQAAMIERLKSLPYVRGLYVVGPNGFIIHDTYFPATTREGLADRPYFRFHQENPGAGLHIGPPLRSRSSGVWFVSLSRRITNADGSFGGIVAAAVEPHYFKRFYKDVSMGENDLISLLLGDGTLLARTPHTEGSIGKSYSSGPIIKLAATQGNGIVWDTSPIDGTRRMVGYRTVAGGALVVCAGRAEASIYDAWIEHAAIVGGGAILVWILAAGLTLLRFEYRRREQLEQVHLAQVQRLEMMGRIAGGIAHDLGNTVRVARTAFSLLKPSLADRADAMALVEEADRSLKSAFEIIDRLLAFARRQELSPRPTVLGDLILGFAPILRQAVGPRIQLDLDVSRRLVCSIDPIHLESALLNLVLNSKDAMPDGGRIAIELDEAQAPRSRKKRLTRPARDSSWAQIVVRDDGSGMSREVLERAFEPFFTTRTGGSGLGLSQVLGFVQQSAGEIRIDSREGGGTAVKLLFPTVPDALEAAAPSPSSAPAAATDG